jgi:hypothetical protein
MIVYIFYELYSWKCMRPCHSVRGGSVVN